MQITCRGEWLSAYVDGELGPEAAAEVRQHLAACPTCQTYLKELQELTALMAIQIPDAPPGLAAHVMSALPAQMPVRTTARLFVSIGVALELGVTVAVIAFVALAVPYLGHAWRIVQKLVTVFWTVGTWQPDWSSLAEAGAVAGLAALLVGLAIYGTHLLDKSGERTV